MCDLICDVISCCVYDKIMIENQKKANIWKLTKFVHKSPSKRLLIV